MIVLKRSTSLTALCCVVMMCIATSWSVDADLVDGATGFGLKDTNDNKNANNEIEDEHNLKMGNHGNEEEAGQSSQDGICYGDGKFVCDQSYYDRFYQISLLSLNSKLLEACYQESKSK